MTEFKYQVWVDDSWLVGHIIVNDKVDTTEDEILDHAYIYARNIWSVGVQRNQVSVCKINK